MDPDTFVANLRETMAYHSAPGRRTCLSRLPGGPSLVLYSRFIHQVLRANRAVSRHPTNRRWLQDGCVQMVNAIEKAGGTLAVTGLEHLRDADGPVVIIGNHMSTLETVMLQGFMLLFNDVTFVVKESLLTYPFFGPIMREVEPVAVSRVNAREDLTQVMKQGQARLDAGRSVVIFPQSTRSRTFDTTVFNSLGVKLARRAGVPVVPLALKTDIWSNGTLLKEFGPVDPTQTVRFAFGPAMAVEGTGKATHQAVVTYITSHLRDWGIPVIDTPADEAAATSGTPATPAG